MPDDSIRVPTARRGDAGAARFDEALTAFLGQRADLATRLEATIAAAPDHVAAHCLAGFAAMLAARADLFGAAGQSLARASAAYARHGGDIVDAALIAALAAWHDDGDMFRCADRLDNALAVAPDNALLLRLSHAVRFMLGDAAGMRRAIESALPAWDETMPAYPYVLGCHAFALGETGELTRAEWRGRDAVAMAPCDLWGAHAVAHAMGGLGRPRDGIAWVAALAPQLAVGGSFVRHIHWHRALCHLRLGEPAAALELHDRRICEPASLDVRDLLNAASLLWRLEAAGVAVGPARWRGLAEIAAGRIGDHAWVFADLHYVLCLAAAGRRDDLTAMIGSIAAQARHGAGTQAEVHAVVGLDAARAIGELICGSRATAAGLFDAALPHLSRAGGSIAQRDLLHRMRQAAGAVG